MNESPRPDDVRWIDELKNWDRSGTWLAVIGYPIQHSISPAMQNAALADLARKDARFADWKYLRFEVHPNDLAEAVAAFRKAGFRGINLTVPHKVEVLPFVDILDPGAERMGSVNTIRFSAEGAEGFSTDGYGLEHALVDAFGCGLTGRDVLILGAGGASRAAVAECLASNVASVALANRTQEKAEALAGRLREYDENNRLKVLDLQGVAGQVRPGTVVINATSLGLRESDPLPVDVGELPEQCQLFDMIYNPPETPFLEAGRRRGYPVANGLGMLVHQGVRSLEIWTGTEVDAAVMDAAARRCLG